MYAAGKGLRSECLDSMSFSEPLPDIWSIRPSGVTGKDKAAAVSHHVEIFTERQEFSFERRNTYYFKMKAFSEAGR